jgi:thiamine biosynthesis protein ThiS
VTKLGEITVKVRVIGQRAARKVMVPQKTRMSDLLDQLGQNRETVVVRLNGKIVAEEERLADGDSAEILTVVAGG